MVIVVDSISFQLPIAQLPISGVGHEARVGGRTHRVHPERQRVARLLDQLDALGMCATRHIDVVDLEHEVEGLEAGLVGVAVLVDALEELQRGHFGTRLEANVIGLGAAQHEAEAFATPLQNHCSQRVQVKAQMGNCY